MCVCLSVYTCTEIRVQCLRVLFPFTMNFRHWGQVASRAKCCTIPQVPNCNYFEFCWPQRSLFALLITQTHLCYSNWWCAVLLRCLSGQEPVLLFQRTRFSFQHPWYGSQLSITGYTHDIHTYMYTKHSCVCTHIYAKPKKIMDCILSLKYINKFQRLEWGLSPWKVGHISLINLNLIFRTHSQLGEEGWPHKVVLRSYMPSDTCAHTQ